MCAVAPASAPTTSHVIVIDKTMAREVVYTTHVWTAYNSNRYFKPPRLHFPLIW